MREILFRGKRIDNGEWVFGDFIREPFGYCIQVVTHSGNEYSRKKYVITEETVGQYTGLTDKNGKRIFEGDILKSHYDFLFPDDVTFELVVFCDSAWCIQQKGFEPAPACADMISELSEVAGNIYDNPELLERGTP